ncbi:MAG: hypothetical protein V4670_04265 [Bacteroidota bacterium]
MTRSMITYTKLILERVSSDPAQFCRELANAIKILIASELEELAIWFVNFTKERPELQHCNISSMG